MLTDANEKLASATRTSQVLSLEVSCRNPFTHRKNHLFCPCQLCESGKQQEAEVYTKIIPLNQFAPVGITLILLTYTEKSANHAWHEA